MGTIARKQATLKGKTVDQVIDKLLNLEGSTVRGKSKLVIGKVKSVTTQQKRNDYMKVKMKLGGGFIGGKVVLTVKQMASDVKLIIEGKYLSRIQSLLLSILFIPTLFGFFWKLDQDRRSRKLVKRVVKATIPETLGLKTV